MKDKRGKPASHAPKTGTKDGIDFPGYPLYPVSEDIYNQGQVEESIDPEDTSKIKTSTEDDGAGTEKDPIATGFDNDISGDELDVPGSELDDDDEKVGSEDEENNYYSLGGDNHNDLEENKGE